MEVSVKGKGRGQYQQTNPVKKFKSYLSTGPLQTISTWIKNQTKLNKKYKPSFHCMSSMEVTPYKNL